MPHEKQSRYAQLVLDIWLNKSKPKATKKKLTQALKEINAKKAIGKLVVGYACRFLCKIHTKYTHC